MATPAWAQAPTAAATERLSLDMLYARKSIIGTSPEGYAWSPDSSEIAFLWDDEGRSVRDIWVYDVKTAKKRQVTRLAKDDAAGKGVGQVVWLGGKDKALAYVAGDKLFVAGASGRSQPLEAERSGVGKLAVSPDGRSLAFVSGGALWVRAGDPADATPARLLVPAAEKVAVESFEWSKDGSRIAFVLGDDSAVRQIDIYYDAGGKAQHDHVTRAFPGDPHVTKLTIGVLDLATGKTVWMARPDDEQPIWGYGLSSDGRRLFVNGSDFLIKTHSVYVYDVASATPELFYRSTDPKQIRPDGQVEWAPKDDGLLILTDRGGYGQLYHQAMARQAPRQLTTGTFEIASFEVDTTGGQIYFISNQAGLPERQLYRVAVSGGAIQRLTTMPGTHEPVLSPDFRYAADRVSNDQTPPELYVADLRGPSAGARVTTSPLPSFYKQRWADVRYVEFPSHVDGARLIGRLTLPPGFDPTKRYPLIVGSVYSDAVHNQWGGRTAHPTWGLDQNLAARGYIILNVNIRGSWGQGKAWNRPMHESYGGLDIDDLESGVRALVAKGYVDPRRVGIWGSSYGGLMTLMSLFKKPGVYAAGIAGAPATNVFHAYPEQEWIAGDAKGADFQARFERQSALFQSKGLKDPLMIIHGTKDVVVLYSDTMALTEKMIRDGKSFELVTLPGAVHGWDTEELDQTRFAFGKMIDFFDRHLKP